MGSSDVGLISPPGESRRLETEEVELRLVFLSLNWALGLSGFSGQKLHLYEAAGAGGKCSEGTSRSNTTPPELAVCALSLFAFILDQNRNHL